MEFSAMSVWKRSLSVVVSLVLACTLCPLAAYAHETIMDDAQADSEVVQVASQESSASQEESSLVLLDEPVDPEKIDIAQATVSGISTVNFTGKAVAPKITVKMGSKTLTNKKDYIYSYSNNAAPGTATLTVVGVGAYTGTLVKTFTILPMKAGVEAKGKLAGSSKWYKNSEGKAVGLSSTTSKGLTRLSIKRVGAQEEKGSIVYKVYVKGKGWSKQCKDGKAAGKASRPIQGLKVKLTGELGEKYKVYYRADVIGSGWTGWGKNNDAVGAARVSNIRGFQVKLVKKGSKFSGSTRKKSVQNNSENRMKYAMALKAQKESSSSKYLILTNTRTNRVAIFKGKKGNWKVFKYMKCTSGASGSPTVRGHFTIGDRGLHFGEEKGYTCWYWTQFHDNYLFHSVLYSPGSKSSIQSGILGVNASHGCVRLAIKNAKWINKNIPRGTKVYVYR